METIYRRCAGLDVHEAFVVACRRVRGSDDRVEATIRRFSTMTADLLALAEWLAEAGVTHVAMESTGVFWKPVWNLLEDRFTIVLVNPRHVKQVPGRKTDVADADWLAQLLQYGLLKSSFIPPEPIRDLRDLTRHRTSLLHERTRTVNRIHKVLEDANIKLSAVACHAIAADVGCKIGNAGPVSTPTREPPCCSVSSVCSVAEQSTPRTQKRHNRVFLCGLSGLSGEKLCQQPRDPGPHSEPGIQCVASFRISAAT